MKSAKINPARISPAEEIIRDIAEGRIVVLVDDEDRENEGDLIVAAEKATPEAINFMARHGRGLICLCLTEERVKALELSPMVERNRTRHATAFTQSIDAAGLVGSPVSSENRARTVATAIDHASGPDSIVVGGHMFPLISRPGGVLVRTGHTEAAVDLSRLAGFDPSAVICEVMNGDGTMARLDDLRLYAAEHGLKLGTIRDLILYRRRHDNLIALQEERQFQTDATGTWNARVYSNTLDGSLIVAITKGRIDPTTPTLVRMHIPEPFADLFGEIGQRKGLIDSAMNAIADAGEGVLVLISESSLASTLNGIKVSSGRSPHRKEGLRDYGIGAQVLADIGVRDIRLLTNSHVEPVGLEAYGLRIVEEVPIAPQP